jgi:hypothetical protein
MADVVRIPCQKKKSSDTAFLGSILAFNRLGMMSLDEIPRKSR